MAWDDLVGGLLAGFKLVHVPVLESYAQVSSTLSQFSDRPPNAMIRL